MEPGIQHADSSTAMWVVSMGVEHWAQGDHLSRKPGMLGNFTDVRGKNLVRENCICYQYIFERNVLELIPVLGSQPAGDASHKLPLLSAKPAVTLATLKRAATSVAAW